MEFVWTAGTVDACPATLARGGLELTACARAAIGALDAEGKNLPKVGREARLWLAFGGVARARVSIAGGFFLEIEGGVSAPVFRERFIIEPREYVFRANAVTWSGGAGAGWSFP